MSLEKGTKTLKGNGVRYFKIIRMPSCGIWREAWLFNSILYPYIKSNGREFIFSEGNVCHMQFGIFKGHSELYQSVLSSAKFYF